MSDENYRNHMMRTFEQNGLLDQLKVQLRTTLLEKLRDRDKTKAVSKDAGLARKISASLIQEYLFFNGHHYSLSVFTPEAGSGPLYQRGELAALLRVDKDVESSLLQSMLRGRLPGEQGCRMDAMMQTEGSNNFLLDQKLRQLDDHYYRGLKNEGSSEQKIVKFQNETRRRMKEQLDRQVDRIRGIEAAAIRAEESEKARLRLNELKQQLQQQYFDKLNKLKEREQEAITLCRHKAQQLESKSHAFRQRMESELEYIHLKEEELKQRQIKHEDWLTGEKAKLERQERILKEQLKKQGILL